MGMFKKDRYAVDVLTLTKDPEVRPTLWKKGENQTFDNLWDWRLGQGNPFLGNAMQVDIPIFNPNNQQDFNPLAGTNKLRESQKHLKNERFRALLRSGDESPSVASSIRSPPTPDKVDIKDIKDLVTMTSLNPQSIQTKFGPKKRILREIGKLHVEDKFEEYEWRKARAKSKEKLNPTLPEERENDSFNISDEDDNIKRQTIITDSNQASLKSYTWIKKTLKQVIQRRKLENKLRSNNDFVDLKFDEDFCKVGDIDIADNGYNNKIEFTQTSQADHQKQNFNEDISVDGIQKTEGNSKHIPLEATETRVIQDNKDIFKNSAFNIVKNVLQDKNKVFTKMKKTKQSNKSKKNKKISKEELLENNEELKIIKYYQRNKYNNLKLEVKYPYDSIPATFFNSTLDALPLTVKRKKRFLLEEDSQLRTKEDLQLKYHSSITATRKKQKTKKDSKFSLRITSMNSPTSDISFKLSSENSDEGINPEIESLPQSITFEYDRYRASERKIQRKQLFKQNDKFIIEKPFPIADSDRIHNILAEMTRTDSTTSIGINKVFPLQSKKENYKRGECLEEVNAYMEFFYNLEADDAKEHQDYTYHKGFNDYNLLFNQIRKLDQENEEIGRFNWSGNQLFSLSKFTDTQTEKCINALNTQVTEIWMQGFSGFDKVLRRYSREIIESNFVNNFLMSCVFVNTIMMALDGLSPPSWDPYLTQSNFAFTIIFTLETLLKLYGYGLKRFSKDFFNIFDAGVVVISLIEVSVNFMSDSGSATASGKSNNAASAFRAVRIFRIFRVLRVTRLLRSLHFMKVIIEVVKSTLEQFVYIAVLMFLFVFIFTLLGTQIFGGNFTFKKDYEYVRYNFDSFETAFYTSFILLTLENWNTILVSCLRSDASSVVTIIYMIAWIFIGNYIFLNLFLAILLDGFENAEHLQLVEELDDEIQELERMQKELVKVSKEKKQLEKAEEDKNNEKIMILIDPVAYKEKKAVAQGNACYTIVRDDIDDGDSLSEELDMEIYLNKKFNAHQIKQDPYAGSTCYRSLFYFTKYNPIRRFAATVVSHPKYSFSYLDSRQSSSFSSSPGPSSSSLRPISTLQISDRLEKLSLTGLTESSRSSSR
jgi:hypothetical protein